MRADIYAVGATLYYLLTGQPPFDARDLGELFARVTTEPPKSPRLRRPEIPAGLAAVVLRCLAKTPAERPASYAALADALRPFSSLDDSPARPGLRLLAGVVDSAILNVILAVWRGWTVDPFVQTTTAFIASWAWLLGLAYYFCFEGFWSASPGKRLFGLRVTSTDGGAPSWSGIARRTAIFHVPNLLSTLLVLAAGALAFTTPRSAGVNRLLTSADLREAAGSLATLVLVAVLFLTARRHNGWAGLHDLASGTRVVSRAASVRRVRTSPDLAPALAGATSTPGLRYGPFTVVSDAGDTDSGRLLLAFDPVLRRQVWIHTVPPHTPAISAARRDVSRVGRLHWLTGGRSANHNWDAFEAPDGGPLLAREGPGAAWSTVKVWLLDLATELAAAAHDGSMPSLGLDRIWLRNDGHVVLLDFPAFAGPRHTDGPASARQAPFAVARHTDAAASARQAPFAVARHTDAPASVRHGLNQSDLTPVGLLSAVAARGLSVTAHTPEQPAPLPLSARALLDDLVHLLRLRGSTPRGRRSSRSRRLRTMWAGGVERCRSRWRPSRSWSC